MALSDRQKPAAPATLNQLWRHADRSRTPFSFAAGPQPRLQLDANIGDADV